MKRKNIIIAMLALGLATSSLVAQDGPPPGRPGPGGEDGGRVFRHRMLPPPLVTALDANHDGTLSADEITNSSVALKTLDKNGDGQITGDELRPPPPQRPEGPGPGPEGERHGPRPGGEPKGPPPGQPGVHKFHREGVSNPPIPPMIGALDVNHDKTISADEIGNASAALKTLDKNGDGQLTMEELRPERRPPPQGDN